MTLEKKSCLLFDLDGTLTDPAEGIVHAVQYALKAFGKEATFQELLPFIGPPLKDSFMEFVGLGEADAERAIPIYREYYAEKGLFENQVYPGIALLLRGLREKGYRLFLATSKPAPFAERILCRFGLREFFEGVGGATLDGAVSTKAQVIDRLMSEKEISPEDAVMIGDRKHDILGAGTFSIPTVGVLYGYGSQKELEAAGAARIVPSVPELARLFGLQPLSRYAQAVWRRKAEGIEDAFFIREEVFVKEQGFVDEFDETDETCLHLILYDGRLPIGCARIFPDKGESWHIGRVAVLKAYRGLHMGERLMNACEERIRLEGGKRAVLSAQCQAAGFYQKQGYQITSNAPYLDQHCPHLDMEKPLS